MNYFWRAMKKQGIYFLVVGALVLGGFLGYTYNNNIGLDDHESSQNSEIDEVEVIETRYGYDVATHHFEAYPLKYGTFIADLLLDRDVSYNKIYQLEKAAEEVLSLRKIKAGKDITFVYTDKCEAPVSFIYRPDLFTCVDYSFSDSISVIQKDIPFTTCQEIISGTIAAGSSLSQSMGEKGLSLALTDELEDALAQVYFPSAQPGDKWKIVYDQKYIDDDRAGSGHILAASYKSGNSESFGFYFENDRYQGYYDIEGTPNKKTFLRAPVRASRISSFFNMNRFHPVLKRRKPHLGTDYAAPRGTPIFSVSDGIITRRGYTNGNGNFIKIKHDGVYQSQYLHMSKFKSGLRVGSRVKQGEVIGYVGKTGLATGNHVCFRFWKNGRQINHLRENFPPLDPMPAESLPEYFEVRDDFWRQLEAHPYDDTTPTVYSTTNITS
jgi:murein DD-endopeptidase MepM/ murein hydrolase activator NlpD